MNNIEVGWLEMDLFIVVVTLVVGKRRQRRSIRLGVGQRRCQWGFVRLRWLCLERVHPECGKRHGNGPDTHLRGEMFLDDRRNVFQRGLE